MNTPNNNFFDMLNLASLLIGLQNLSENREQSEHNDVQKANDKQAEYMLKEIYRLFEEQNKMITEIHSILKYIIDNDK